MRVGEGSLMKRLTKMLTVMVAGFLLAGMLTPGFCGGVAEIKEESKETVTRVKEGVVEAGKEIKDGAVKTGGAVTEKAKEVGQGFKKVFIETKEAIKKEISGGENKDQEGDH